MQRRGLVSLLENSLEHFKQAYRRDDQFGGKFDRRSKESCIWATGKILQPARRIHYVHTRSGSRSTVVSIPFRNPLAFLMGSSGTSSILPSYGMTWTRWPGRSPNARRTRSGMTTWNFGDTLDVSIRISNR